MDMHNAHIKNIVHTELQEQEDRRQKLGCPVDKGCVKGKEHDNFINGTYKSDKNDIRTFIKKQVEINEIGNKKHSEAMLMLSNVLAQLGTVLAKIQANEEKVEKMDKVIERFDIRMWGIAGAICLMCIGTVWGVWKVNSVDRTNQGRTEAIMMVLATNLSGKSSEKIAEEIQETMIKFGTNKDAQKITK